MIYYGDEVAMTGGKDPDCRRGMLWDEARRDGDMLQWYQTLLRLRREHPVITRGRVIRETAWDAEGLIRVTRRLEGREVTLVFHNKAGSLSLPELAGKTDAITGQPFDGTLRGIRALVFL